MTRTEAAEVVARDVRDWSRREGIPITSDLVMQRMTEAAAGHRSIYLGVCARNCNPKTVLRLAKMSVR